MTTATMEMPAATAGFEVSPVQMDTFHTGVLNGRKDVIVLMMGFIFNNQRATRDDIWDFVLRLDDVIKKNPTVDILELSALVKQGEV